MTSKSHLSAAGCLFVLLLMLGCSDTMDPLAPGSFDGRYSVGVKALIPLASGNSWMYSVSLYDTTGLVRSEYTFRLYVRDTVTADTGRIPLVPPRIDRRGMSPASIQWYLVEGELGQTTCWQVDTLDIVRIRPSDDARFYEQYAFDLRAALGDSTVNVFVDKDTVVWASGDRFSYDADSARTILISKGADTLRTALGSAPYYQYRLSYASRQEFVDYYFKPGFGMVLREYYRRTPGGQVVLARRDALTSYSFR